MMTKTDRRDVMHTPCPTCGNYGCTGHYPKEVADLMLEVAEEVGIVLHTTTPIVLDGQPVVPVYRIQDDISRFWNAMAAKKVN